VGLIAATLNEGFVRVGWLKALVHAAGNWVIIVAQAVLLCGASLFIKRRKEPTLGRYGKATRV